VFIGKSASSIDFLPFSDVEPSVKEDVGTIRKNPFLPKDVEVTGWIYDDLEKGSGVALGSMGRTATSRSPRPW
jgi:carbonic anhydrase